VVAGCANLVSATADEISCRLYRIARQQGGVPLLRVRAPNRRCLTPEPRAAGCALLQNEYSDDVWIYEDSTIRISQEQS
jgi:hypothetical protein